MHSLGCLERKLDKINMAVAKKEGSMQLLYTNYNNKVVAIILISTVTQAMDLNVFSLI